MSTVGTPFSALALLLCALAASVSAETSALEPCADAGLVQRWVDEINRLRVEGSACAAASPNAGRLVWESHLAGSAQAQAADLALRDTVSHVDARQRPFDVRLRDSGYPTASAGENLAAGQREFAGVLKAWQASAAHCSILMQPRFTEVGLACVQRKGTRYERFWVAHLGAPRTR